VSVENCSMRWYYLVWHETSNSNPEADVIVTRKTGKGREESVSP